MGTVEIEFEGRTDGAGTPITKSRLALRVTAKYVPIPSD